MTTTISKASKKSAKRKPKRYEFHKFADSGSPSIDLSGAFRDNITVFLQEYGKIEQYKIERMQIWCTKLVNESNGVHLPLFTVEESVKNSSRPTCDHCRCAGWSHHFVSKLRYHFIIPKDKEWNRPPEGQNVFDLQTHLLHGLIHCNGFGHLLCINGLEGGSKFLCGREIMDLWDRICTLLRTRKITVVDLSQKRSMDLRLLHGVAYGHPWFGSWGYKFHRGSFGITRNQYDKAIEVLSSLNLDNIISDICRLDTTGKERLKTIIRNYSDASETKLITLRDLLRSMLTLKAPSASLMQRKSKSSNTTGTAITTSSKPPLTKSKSPTTTKKEKEEQVKLREFSTFAANKYRRWTSKRLEDAAELILKVLKETKMEGRGGMSRNEVRDVTRDQIGDTGLLDSVLKSLNNFIVGNYVVRRAINPSTRVLEYTVEDVTPADLPEISSLPGLDDVYTTDILILYQTVLKGYPETELAGVASGVVMDCKHFVKDYWHCNDKKADDALLRWFECRVIPDLTEMDSFLTRSPPPGELLVLEPHATVRELKMAAEKAIRDTNYLTEEFEIVAMEVDGLKGKAEDGDVLIGTVESGAQVWVTMRGRGRGRERGMDSGKKERLLVYEGGADDWSVDCCCNARDDDGERMVSCDFCEVWQHTRCSGIEDSETPPSEFGCERCRESLIPQLDEEV